MKNAVVTLVLWSSCVWLWAGKEVPLIEAAKTGDLAKVQELLDKGQKIDKRNEDKQTALMVAVEGGHPEVVSLLLERGADVTLVDRRKANLFHYAARSGQLALMDTLKARGLPFDHASGRLTPFLQAALSRQKDVLVKLVGWGVDPHQKTPQGDTALHLVAAHNDVPSIEYLIGLGLDVNQSGREGTTPLQAAVLSGSLDAVKSLLNQGADPERADQHGNRPMAYVAFLRSRSMYRLICEHGWEGAALHCSVRGGAVEEVRKQLAAGEPMEAANPVGETPLFVAVAEGQYEVAKLLLEQGAAVDAMSHYLWTSLYTAAWRGDLKMVQLLLAHRAEPNLPVGGGDTPVGIALEGGHQEVAAALIEAGARVLYFIPGTKEGLTFQKSSFDELLAARTRALSKERFQRAALPFWLIRYNEDDVRDPQGRRLDGAQLQQKVTKKVDPHLPPDPDIDLPEFTLKVQPMYPDSAVAERISGYLILQATLGKDGFTRDIAVLRPLGDWRYGFELAAIQALRNWQYKPGKYKGEPCDVRMTLKIDFVLR